MSHRRIAAYGVVVAIGILGCLGVASGLAELDVLGVAVGGAFIAAAVTVFAVHTSIGIRLCEALLVGTIAYHVVASTLKPKQACGCLHAFGDWQHVHILLLASTLLVALVLLQEREVRRQGGAVAGVGAIVLSVGAALVAFLTLPGARVEALHAETAEPLSGLPSLELLPAAVRRSDVRRLPTNALGDEWRITLSEESKGREFEAFLTAGDYAGVRLDPESGELVGETRELPETIVELTPARPIRAAPVQWESGTRRGSVVFEETGGRTIHGAVMDGLGNSLAGLDLVVSDSLDALSIGTTDEILRRARGGLTASALVRSGPDGEFEVTGWRSTGVAVHPGSPGWFQLSSTASASTGRIELRFARMCVAALTVHGGDGVPQWAIDQAVARPTEFAPLPGASRPPAWDTRIDLDSRLPRNLRILNRALIADSRVVISEVFAGAAEVSAPGCGRQAVKLIWSPLGEPVATRVTLASDGSTPVRPRLRLSPGLPDELVGATVTMTAVSVDREVKQHVSAVVVSPGDALEFVDAMRPERYTLTSYLFNASVVLDLATEEGPIPTRPFTVLVVEVTAPDETTAQDLALVVELGDSLVKDLSAAVRWSSGVPAYAVRNGPTSAAYAFPADAPLDLTISAGGPAFKTVSKRVEVQPRTVERVRLSVERRQP